MPKKAELKAKLSIDSSAFTRGIRTAEAAAKSMAKGGLEMAKRGIRDIELVSLAASAALLYGIKRAYDLGHEMQEMSEKTGIAVDQLMILNRAAKDHGIDDISTSVKKMQVNIVEAIKNGTGPAAQAFEALGLSAYDLVNKAPIDQFKEIGKAIATIQNPTVRASEAVAIFGREGSRMLALFQNTGALDAAAKSVGKQAQILKENAERFSEVSIRLSHVGEKMEGFFVGVAKSILPQMEAATKAMEKIDLSSMGEKFGDSIHVAINYLAGIFADPSGLADVLENTMMYAFGNLANFLFDKLSDAALMFSAAMLDGIDSLSRTLYAGMAVASDYLSNKLEHAMDALNDGFVDMVNALIDGVAKAADLLLSGAEAFGKAIHQDVTDIQVARAVVQGLAIMEKLKKNENKDYAKIRTFDEAYAEQKPTVAADLAAETRKGIGSGKGKDYVDAQSYLDSAREALTKLGITGKKFVDSLADAEDKATEARKAWALNTALTPNDYGVQGATNALGATKFAELFSAGRQHMQGGYGGFDETSMLSRGAYAQSPIMKVAERRAFENTLVAQGIRHADSRSSGHGGYHVVRSGDFRRARNVALEREREAQKNQAKNIANIADNTADMASAWGGKGTGAAGS